MPTRPRVKQHGKTEPPTRRNTETRKHSSTETPTHRNTDTPSVSQAFAQLREMLVQRAQVTRVSPRLSVQEDQIVWARSPVRLDLAGGWSDTPPYCLEFGGKVLNLAVDLNGQPPIQVFLKLSKKPQIVLRSIDLGCEERVSTFEQLRAYGEPGSPFGLAKAALALSGFLPDFRTAQPETPAPSPDIGAGKIKNPLSGGAIEIRKSKFENPFSSFLASFGGGLEISLVAAIPKGSGLGTSSILASTILAGLSDFCGLNWDAHELFTRTLALEQMLTTGGGWQDQAGAIFHSVKLIETMPGLAQTPVLRWLPEHLFGPEFVNRSILLYYTGITRMAKNILGEIVRGIFLKSASHLRTIADIAANADIAAAAIQRCDYDGLCDAIRTSWTLNQQLDAGTNPPSVQAILDAVQPELAAAKLLGAGGGGYLLMFAKDESAGMSIRKKLTKSPPNSRARFVDFTLSQTGLRLTRS